VEQVTNSASQRKPAADVGAMSFEAALGELEGIVGRLEQGEVDLEDSIALYERGQALKSHCEAKLKAAEGRLEKLVLGSAGPTSLETMGSELVETV
jgi:exodeoxyribonuclease VII small subunit